MRTHQGLHGSADKQRSRGKLIEEILLDHGSFLSLATQPPPIHMHKQAAKLRTVSIIDTLSELTPGEIDNEDLYGSFHPYLPSPDTFQTSLHQRNLPSIVNGRHGPRRGVVLNDHRPFEVNRKVLRKYDTISALRPVNRQTLHQNRSGLAGSAAYTPTFNSRDREPFVKHRYSGGTDCPYLSDTGLPYVRTLVKPPQRHIVPMSSTPYSKPDVTNTRQKSRWQSEPSRSTQDSLRHCFSDSEIEASELLKMHSQNTAQGTMKKAKFRSDDCLDVDTIPAASSSRDVESWICSLGEPCSLPAVLDSSKANVLPGRHRGQSKMPEWIRFIFRIAKQGNLEMLKAGMKDMDSALVRNLSDCSGNNLWHVCSARNFLPCIQWLSNKFGHEALKDENKSALTPCILAVKHGSLSVVQWLLEHTSCQVFMPGEASRSLLHFAAKYGQGSVLSWLVDYMAKLSMDLNSKDAEGNTSLHLAAKYGHIQCVKDLVLHGGDLSARNELGLRPYDLAVLNRQTSCTEYLISLETGLALATDHYLLESDTQRYRTENSDAKRNFKDLLQLTKNSLRHQREMLEACKQIQSQQLEREQLNNRGEEGDMSGQSLLQQEEFERWFSSLVMKDESVCQMIEDKWKRQSRKAARHNVSKREPLDILRSQFTQTQVKASSLTPLPDVSILSSSGSECSEESDDEGPVTQPIASNILERQLDPRIDHLRSESSPVLSKPKLSRSARVSSTSSRRKVRGSGNEPTAIRPWSLHVTPHPDMDLRDLFECNPEFKQEGQTCSVLEVLEPSSSENEELAQLEKQYAVSVKESKSSNSLESESSLSNGSKSKAKSAQDISKVKDNPVDLGCCMMPAGKMPNTAEQQKVITRVYTTKNGGKDKVKQVDSAKSVDAKACTDSASRSSKGSPSTSNSSDSKSLDSENRTESEILPSGPGDCIESSSPDSSPELSGAGPSGVLKKKGFLLKFSLKNRWSSKQKQRGTKKLIENPPEEVKEVKIESTPSVEVPPPSQTDTVAEISEIGSTEGTTVVVEIHNATVQQPKKVERFLPPPPPTTRRDPPPMPPTENKQYSSPQDCSDSLLPDILDTNTLEETPTEHSSQTEQSGQSSNEQFCSSSDVSRLFCSTAKSDSRPPSSASRIDSTLRPEDAFKGIGFPLRKTSSASTELLLTPDSSTAGRQSPAPSEVSKTESALSPPSDVSKTESQRHASHLGKIEESIASAKKQVEVKVAAIMDIEMESEAAEGQCMQVATYIHQENPTTKEFIPTRTGVKKESSNRPWYEVSDDEDILSPNHPLGNQSNSEDESNSLLR